MSIGYNCEFIIRTNCFEDSEDEYEVVMSIFSFDEQLSVVVKIMNLPSIYKSIIDQFNESTSFENNTIIKSGTVYNIKDKYFTISDVKIINYDIFDINDVIMVKSDEQTKIIVEENRRMFIQCYRNKYIRPYYATIIYVLKKINLSGRIIPNEIIRLIFEFYIS
jgi:hypothetical protein